MFRLINTSGFSPHGNFEPLSTSAKRTTALVRALNPNSESERGARSAPAGPEVSKAKQSKAKQSGAPGPGEQPASLDAREQFRGRSCSGSNNRHLWNHRYLAQPRNPPLCEQRTKRPGYGPETPKGSRGCPRGLRPRAGSAAVPRAHGFPEQRGSAHAPLDSEIAEKCITSLKNIY